MASFRPAVSLVVICYQMDRELPRTLMSLAPPYQRGVEPGVVEIIVVDNGSSALPAADAYRSPGVHLRVLSVAEPTASPVAAINLGLSEARADLIGVWIDGARLASPGLIRACLRASKLHPRPVIATLNYQLGPSLQYLSVPHGYGIAAEDALLDKIAWPADGYRLFEIAACELRAGPTGPMLESNALFLPGALWRELDGYDPAFVEPGGGVVNPDTLIRACALPDTQLIRILAEGTFHQYHGGLSTSTPESAIRTLRDGSRAYLRRRGKPLMAVRSPGWLFDGRSCALLDGSEVKSACAAV